MNNLKEQLIGLSFDERGNAGIVRGTSLRIINEELQDNFGYANQQLPFYNFAQLSNTGEFIVMGTSAYDNLSVTKLGATCERQGTGLTPSYRNRGTFTPCQLEVFDELCFPELGACANDLFRYTREGRETTEAFREQTRILLKQEVDNATLSIRNVLGAGGIYTKQLNDGTMVYNDLLTSAQKDKFGMVHMACQGYFDKINEKVAKINTLDSSDFVNGVYKEDLIEKFLDRLISANNLLSSEITATALDSIKPEGAARRTPVVISLTKGLYMSAMSKAFDFCTPNECNIKKWQIINGAVYYRGLPIRQETLANSHDIHTGFQLEWGYLSLANTITLGANFATNTKTSGGFGLNDNDVVLYLQDEGLISNRNKGKWTISGDFLAGTHVSDFRISHDWAVVLK